MKRTIGTFALAAGMLLAGQASAQLLFSDSLQGSLATPNFIANTNGQIVVAPTGGNALNFAATQGGGDLFSQIIAGTGAGTYRLDVDYLCLTVGGCAGFVGLHPGGTVTTIPLTQGTDNWLATDPPPLYPAPFVLLSTNPTGFTSNSFTFTVSSATPFGLKLEDFAGAAGDAYFRNLSLTAVPEPATWGMMLLGAGMIGFGLRSRRKSKVTTRVTFA